MKTRWHKRLDHFSMLGDIVCRKGVVSSNKFHTHSILESAEDRDNPGPVHFDLTNVDGIALDQSIFQGISREPIEDRIDNINQAVLFNRIKQSSRPVIVLGSMVKRSGWSIKFEKVNVPVVTTAAAKGVIDERLPHVAGIVTGEIGTLAPEKLVMSQADLVIGLGLRVNELVKLPAYPVPLILLDNKTSIVQKNLNSEATFLFDNVDEDILIEQIVAILRKKSWGYKIVAEYWSRLTKCIYSEGEWQLPGVFRILNERSHHQQLSLIVDTGFHCTLAESVWKATQSDDFLGSCNGRFMGISIPSAIGFSIAHPERPVVCMFGDGGLPPYVTELIIAIKHNLPILFIYVSDGRFGSIASYSCDDNVTDLVCKAPLPNGELLAEALGMPTKVINRLDIFESVFSNWLKSPAPIFVKLVFEPRRYAEIAKLLR